MTKRAFWKRVIIITITGANLLILYYNYSYFRKPTGSQQPVVGQPPVQSTDTTPKGSPNPNAEAPQERSGQTPVVTIRFELNSLNLSPQAQVDLLNVFNMMSEKSTLRVEVGGHTDNIGKPIDNLKVSVKRATIVRDHLVKLGILAERIIVQGYGSTKPIADNKTEEGRAQNRRVEIIVLSN